MFAISKNLRNEIIDLLHDTHKKKEIIELIKKIKEKNYKKVIQRYNINKKMQKEAAKKDFKRFFINDIKNYISNGGNSNDVVNLSTNTLKNIQDNVLSKVPILKNIIDPINKYAEPIITGLTEKIFGIHPKLLESAKHYEETGQTGYETDLINKGYGHGKNLNGNMYDAIRLFELRARKHISNPTDNEYIKMLENTLLEPKLKGVLYPMPKRNNNNVTNFINIAIDKGFMGADNLEKYYDWNMIDENTPRNIPGTNIYEIYDPPILA